MTKVWVGKLGVRLPTNHLIWHLLLTLFVNTYNLLQMTTLLHAKVGGIVHRVSPFFFFLGWAGKLCRKEYFLLHHLQNGWKNNEMEFHYCSCIVWNTGIFIFDAWVMRCTCKSLVHFPHTVQGLMRSTLFLFHGRLKC